MDWNWQLPDWPHFQYDANAVAALDKQFLMGAGSAFAYLKAVDTDEYKNFVVEILSLEGMESSKIEGEILDRKSLQSSIRKHFGLEKRPLFTSDKEAQMAELLCDVYDTFDEPLTHQMLHKWHFVLFKNSNVIEDRGLYRSHEEPMQIVSNRLDQTKVFFQAPPSQTIEQEMARFIKWFNSTQPNDSLLAKAAIAHLYFECIHPFEDGNGRLGRLLVEKILSQGIGRPVLIAVSKVLEKQKKNYYTELERCNRTLNIQDWIQFFSLVIMQAHHESIQLLHFIIQKSKVLNRLSGLINPRQEKTLLRMFKEGPSGFKSGLSAENYVKITKTSRATATRDLLDLVNKEVLLKTGSLRHTRYWLNMG